MKLVMECLIVDLQSTMSQNLKYL